MIKALGVSNLICFLLVSLIGVALFSVADTSQITASRSLSEIILLFDINTLTRNEGFISEEIDANVFITNKLDRSEVDHVFRMSLMPFPWKSELSRDSSTPIVELKPTKSRQLQQGPNMLQIACNVFRARRQIGSCNRL
jgi:hypothetical protein